jgi:hypothetical protein
MLLLLVFAVVKGFVLHQTAVLVLLGIMEQLVIHTTVMVLITLQ